MLKSATPDVFDEMVSDFSEIAENFLDEYSMLTHHILSKIELRRVVQASVRLPEELRFVR